MGFSCGFNQGNTGPDGCLGFYLQHPVLTQDENSRGVDWLVKKGLGKTAMLISSRISSYQRQRLEMAVLDTTPQEGQSYQLFERMFW